ncbi:aldo/keto reductase [Leptolyngbya boryana NIES-2135]|jgi:aryl-alcohol dehydrogenase-like predicted oxidoreductase|uniref:Aldo/keto reductase n=1 Tax=Leptolyngbya boryana NIES-2135 TaxID=1973484 RepID=A0A1Z4JJD0_LEPBY|nr:MULTISPECIES: aldo/keto reductase family protein [Leptolyngbya]BAY56869.1 aldo/keto reductase [Leptolyngbya boryana NIES-2135]MBD2368946.1 aldo/keto reductase family protein [Leptolyngbya sp. FACHB-161]MBD2375846.1 aldo/keto reductase family protein [Leptolyngbya sp. FACHB-238]MBD2399960.1 aldo/keto reductase family protein [Leptolyngbya sp. FACHB-239]MBD2406166.1 aldo/keto reductase family protein [Leptolyngbya sp. FACHB-402]
MKYRRLGDSDLNVSEIILGSWLTYSGGVERQNAEACVHKAFDVGINFIDTANVYGRGSAESFLGEVLQGIDRSSYVLATKVYFPMSDTDQGLSAAQIRKQIDASLQRLKTDYVDLYQCHRYDENTPLEETMTALTEVVQQGKARYIGFSEWSPSQIQAALNLPNVAKFVSSQPQYSMLWRKPEAEVFPLCAANGIGQIVWSPLAQGVLTGKYKPGEAPPQDSRAANSQMNGFMGDFLNDQILSAVQDLSAIAEELNISMAQLALAWVLRDQQVTGAIIGASRPEQVEDNAAASDVTLSAAELQEIDRILQPALTATATR